MMQSAALSFAEQRLWFADQLGIRSGAYNVSLRVAINGTVDVACLEKAVRALVERHDALRSTFRIVNDEPRRVIGDGIPVLRQADVRAEDDWRRALELAIAEESATAFILRDGPPFRALLIRVPDGYVFVMSMPHIVCDAWSANVLMNDFSNAYSMAKRSETVTLATATPWRDRDGDGDNMMGGLLQSTKSYWDDQFAAAMELPELCLEAGVQGRGRHGLATMRRMIPATAHGKVVAFARGETATPFMVYLAIYQLVLARSTAAERVAVGVPITTRNGENDADLVGCFVNLLPVIGDVRGAPSFRQYVSRVRHSCLDAYTHARVPAAQTMQGLGAGPVDSEALLFQTLFSFHSEQIAAPKLEGASVSVALVPASTAKVDLEVSVRISEHGAEMIWEWDEDRLTRNAVERLADRFETLRDAALAAPDESVHRLSMLTAEEQARCIAWNDTRQRYPDDVRSVPELIEAQVRRTPDAIAVAFAEQRLSYRELGNRIDRFATKLRATGVGRGDVVAVMADRTIDLPGALCAILRVGAAYLPLSPADPDERVRRVFDDARPRAVLADEAYRERAHRLGGRDVFAVALGETDGLERGALSEIRTPRSVDAAYVIYTSGTTGAPKGVVNTHAGLTNRLSFQQEVVGLGPGDAVLQKTSYTSDVSVWEFFWPLMAGARLVLAKNGGQGDPLYVESVIDKEAITVVHFVPSMLRSLLHERPAPACRSLRAVICSGEALTSDLVTGLQAKVPGVEIYNFYGPTEASIDATMWRCPSPHRGDTVPIGRPIANMTAHVLDGELQPVGIGTPGDLWLGGVGLARGYLRNPRITAERFIPNPFGPAGARMYKTGDRARRSAHGDIEFLGRSDDQIKVRGHRIEPAEIEAALAREPNVDAAAVVVEGRDDLATLVAFVSPPEVAADGGRLLRANLERQLPRYMVPSRILGVPSLPLTSSGKLDRRALAANVLPAAALDRGHPQGPIEEAVAKIWCDVLGATVIGRADDFFQLGGHSLAAVRVTGEVRRRLGRATSLGDLFGARTLEAFAVRVAAAPAVEEPGLAPPPKLVGGAPSPLSFAQERMWFLEKLMPGTPAYNVALGFKLKGRIDAESLNAALVAVVMRHEMLRARFEEVDGVPLQHFAQPPAEILVVDKSDDGVDADEWVRHAGSDAFDLRSGPLLRARLLRRRPDEFLLVIVAHHIAVDGTSIEVIVREVSAAYAALSAGRPWPASSVPSTYVEFVRRERLRMTPEKLKQLSERWRARLAGHAGELLVHPDRAAGAVQPQQGSTTVAVELSEQVSSDLSRLAASERTTSFTIYVAAVGLLFAGMSGESDTVLGIPVALRTEPGFEDVVGLFVNTTVVRTDYGAATCFRDAVRMAHASIVESLSDADMPFDRLVDLVRRGRGREAGRRPVFQVMVEETESPCSLVLDGAAVEAIDFPTHTAKFDLLFSLERRRIGGRMTLEYDTSLFRKDKATGLLEQLAALLAMAVAAPDAAISPHVVVDDRDGLSVRTPRTSRERA